MPRYSRPGASVIRVPSDRGKSANQAEEGSGLRPEVARLLGLVDTTDDSWPMTAGLLREMALAGVDLDEASVTAAVKLGRRRWEQLETNRPLGKPRWGSPALATASVAIVYYIRRGDLIKIGTTVDPVQRFEDLMPDEILAFEPGGYVEETFRHRQFDHLRRRGEHFTPEPELLHHVSQVRHLYGDPDPSWPTKAMLDTGRRILLPPSTGETMTAAEAASRLGIRPGTLAGWVHRRKLAPVGKDEKNRQLYHADHLVMLRDNPRAYLRAPDQRVCRKAS